MAADENPRPRRSVLFVPASNPRAMDKARGLDCDVVILDLEDAVGADMKTEARAAVTAAVREGFDGREVVVRCNGLDTAWGAEDLAALAAAGPDAVLVPKARTAADISAYERALAGAPTTTRLWAMIETAAGVLNLAAIAGTGTRLDALVLGPNDLSAELRLKPLPGRAALQPMLSRVVVAARAHGLAALDGVFNAIGDDEGLAAECAQAAAFGFDGKTLIHPSQIAPANQAFSPSVDEVEWARAVTAAFAAPDAQGKGAIRVQDRMVERLHLEQARRVLALTAMSR